MTLLTLTAAVESRWLSSLKAERVLATGASFAYFDAYRSERLPANLTQAQRDYFGAHTYKRVDTEGVFHPGWE